jgi:hypothetical protein
MKTSRCDFLRLTVVADTVLFTKNIAEKTGRTDSALNNEDFRPYFRALKEVKFEGRMAIECTWKNLEVQAPTALKAMRKQINEV